MKQPNEHWEMKSIPSGILKRKNTEVQISSFYLCDIPVTKKEWDEVVRCAVGYDMSEGTGDTENTPVGNVTWYDAIKFCNALSELMGLMPVYYRDDTKTEVYRSGILNLSNDCVMWEADGFCLPTEAQWEYACRAGTATRYFWGDTPPKNLNDEYAWAKGPSNKDMYTSEVGKLTPNQFELYDMTGNIFEWCWDQYGEYQNDIDPNGIDVGLWRIMRGGSVALDSNLSSTERHYTYPHYQLFETGFRIASRVEHKAMTGKLAKKVFAVHYEQKSEMNLYKNFFNLLI